MIPAPNPDVWRDDNRAPPYAAWQDSDRYSVPYDPRAAGPFVQATNPTADAAVWSENNVAPFWRIDDPYAPSAGISFDDLVRTIPSIADPDIWPRDESTPLVAGSPWDEASASASERYAVSPDRMRAAALGAFEIPGLPEDAAGWRLNEPTLAGTGGISLAQRRGRGFLPELLKERQRIIDVLRAPGEAIRRALTKKAPPQPGAQPLLSKATLGDVLAPGGKIIGTGNPRNKGIIGVDPGPYQAIRKELTSGVPVKGASTYRGSLVDRLDGSRVGARISKKYGETIDIHRSNDPRFPAGFKIHQNLP